MASDVLLKDGMLVITILCLLKPCGPGYYLDTMEINIGRAVTWGKTKGTLSPQATDAGALDWKNTQNRQRPFLVSVKAAERSQQATQSVEPDEC